MKKKKLLLVFLFIMLPLAIFLSTYFVLTRNKRNDSSTDSSSFISLNEIEPVYKELGSLKIMVDPRIELLTAIQHQSKYQVLTQFDFNYKDDMNTYFSNFKNHKAVKEFKKSNNSGFNYDAPPASMLYVSNPPNLEQKLDYSDYLIDRAGSKEKLLDFNNKLRDFSIDSKFPEFYEKNIPFYQTIVDDVYSNIMDLELTDALDDYYGMEVNSFNLILSPMLHNGGYGPSVEAENGLYDVYGIVGPENTKELNGEIVPEFSGVSISYLVWHEFSHSFVNPTTEKYRKEINQYNNLFSKISSNMKSQAYATWEISVNEHIVRAVTTRLAYLYLGQTAGDAALANEKGRGFYYIEALCESLEEYESNRSTYPTFESYYPQLIKVFKNLSEQDLPDSLFEQEFSGPINSAFNNMDTKDLIVITPTNEENQKTQEEINLYIGIIKDMFWSEAELIDDVDALEKDLSDYIIVAYGTMEGNLWLNHYKDQFPFQVKDDSIMANEEYEGTDLAFITAMANPQNYKNPLIVYTAQSPDAIVDINSVYHGGTDYIIANGTKEVHSGFYDKNKEEWSFRD